MGCGRSKEMKADLMNGLTETEVKVIIDSWDKIHPDKGSKMLFHLFLTDFPRMKIYFGYQETVSVVELMESEQIKAQCKVVWDVLTKIVHASGDGERLAELVKEVSFKHLRFNREKKDIHCFLHALKETLSCFLGHLFKPWNIWCKTVEDLFIIGFEEAERAMPMEEEEEEEDEVDKMLEKKKKKSTKD